MEEYNGNFQMVDPLVIVVDHRYQRPEKAALIAAIATDPRWELFGVPVLFSRGGVLYCADGQQRIAGLKRAAVPPRLIPAVVFSVETLEDEAAVFVQINEFRKALTSMEKHRGKIVAKDPAALMVEGVVAKVGLSVGDARSTDTKTVSAIGSLYWVYNLIGEDGLTQTLAVCRDAFVDDQNAFSGPMLKLVATIILEQNGKYERSKLTAALAKTTPGAIARKAEELHFDMGGSAAANLRRAARALAKV